MISLITYLLSYYISLLKVHYIKESNSYKEKPTIYDEESEGDEGNGKVSICWSVLSS